MGAAQDDRPADAAAVAARDGTDVVDIESQAAAANVEPSPRDKGDGSNSGSSGGDGVDLQPQASVQEGDEDKAAGDGEPAAAVQSVADAGYRDIAWHFGILGWTAFGGPAAHISMFLKLFVEKLNWTTTLVFTELLMLGQCMPGPTSTQMAFAIGVLKRGLSGGLLSGMLFQLPGLIILTILGWVASKVLDEPPEWLEGAVAGLAAAGIALVASAARELVAKICKTRLLQVICTASAVVAYYYPKPWTFPALIVIGGLLTIIFKRKDVIKVEEVQVGVERLGFNKLGGTLLLLAWIGILVGVVVAAGATNYDSVKPLHWFAAFYRTGSVIFGGGQVVLPMLYNDVVDVSCPPGEPENSDLCTETSSSWMTENQFYAGLALAQAMPGPLFNFAAYLGAVIAQNADIFALVGVAVCWVGLFAPGIMIIFGILPWWGMFRKWQIYLRALPGLNAAAVGLIVTSVFQLTLSAYGASPFPNASISIGIMTYGFNDVLKIPAPITVIAGGVTGIIAWATGMN